MGLEVYYPKDIRNALLAAEQSSGAALKAGGELLRTPDLSLDEGGTGHRPGTGQNGFAQGYQEGYRAALTTIALAFGLIRPEGPGPRCRDEGRSGSYDQGWQPAFLSAHHDRNGSNGKN